MAGEQAVENIVQRGLGWKLSDHTRRALEGLDLERGCSLQDIVSSADVTRSGKASKYSVIFIGVVCGNKLIIIINLWDFWS